MIDDIKSQNSLNGYLRVLGDTTWVNIQHQDKEYVKRLLNELYDNLTASDRELLLKSLESNKQSSTGDEYSKYNFYVEIFTEIIQANKPRNKYRGVRIASKVILILVMYCLADLNTSIANLMYAAILSTCFLLIEDYLVWVDGD